MVERKVTIYGNTIMEGNGFYISYNETPLASDSSKDETALVIKADSLFDRKFYILNGNWLDKYEPLVEQGYEACKEFFDNHKKEYISSWSEDYQYDTSLRYI